MNTSSLPVPQNIIVTGGGRGLGYEMAQALVEAGHRVLITGTRAGQELQSVARLSNPECNAHKLAMCSTTTPPIKTAVRCEEFHVGLCTAGITSSVNLQKKSLKKIARIHQNRTLVVSRNVRGSEG